MGGQFGLEFAIDAPWRLEPIPAPNGSVDYGPIPISITFADAIFETYRAWTIPGSPELSRSGAITVGNFRRIEIVEYTDKGPSAPTAIGVNGLREIERKGWVSTKSDNPPYVRCRPHTGVNCDPLLDITFSHEWHGFFWFKPARIPAPGENARLKVTVVTERGGTELRWSNYLSVHYAKAPLPRFSNDWVYGDFHYHSQMTDNDGETGYSYRNVARTLGAMGMDFVFATDHASDGEQQRASIEAWLCKEHVNVTPLSVCDPKKKVVGCTCENLIF